MGYPEPHLWVDDPGAKQDERIGEHEGYGTLYDVANDRYLGNHVPWVDSLGTFLAHHTDNSDVLLELLNRFRVVPRCHCDAALYGGAEWTGSKQEIIHQGGVVDFEATTQDLLAAWRFHVESRRKALADRLWQRAAKQRAGYLVALDQFAALDSAKRFAAIRTARATLDRIEVEAVIEERRKGRNWGEIGLQLGTTKQAARRRFLKHDPQGAEVA